MPERYHPRFVHLDDGRQLKQVIIELLDVALADVRLENRDQDDACDREAALTPTTAPSSKRRRSDLMQAPRRVRRHNSRSLAAS